MSIIFVYKVSVFKLIDLGCFMFIHWGS